MSEKRFTLNLMKKPSEIEMDGKMISKYDVVRLLNEQQALISALKKENKQLKAENNTPLPYVETGLKFARAEKKISEQQATIQSLKEENKRLKFELKRICNLECENCKEEWCEKK